MKKRFYINSLEGWSPEMIACPLSAGKAGTYTGVTAGAGSGVNVPSPLPAKPRTFGTSKVRGQDKGIQDKGTKWTAPLS
jgi:hypothetical protein